jgi:hypothetical protein
MYSDFVLLFKRSFEEIWDIWMHLNCAPDLTNWFTYFVTAILLEIFPRLSVLPEISITRIMEEFAQAMKEINPRRIAVWLWKNHLLPVVQSSAGPAAPAEPPWTRGIEGLSQQ